MSDALKPLIGAAADRPLTRAEAEQAFTILFEGEATPSQIGGLLMAMRTRGETVDEYAAAAAVMRAKCNAVTAPEGAMDIVGTRGRRERYAEHFDCDRICRGWCRCSQSPNMATAISVPNPARRMRLGRWAST